MPELELKESSEKSPLPLLMSEVLEWDDSLQPNRAKAVKEKEKAEAKAAEEKRRAEEAAQQEAIRRLQYEPPKVIPNPRQEKAQEQAEVQVMHESAPAPERSFPEPVQARKQADNELQTITLQITGTANQIQKIRGYISYIRAMQKEVPNVING